MIILLKLLRYCCNLLETFGAQGVWGISADGKMSHAAHNNDRFFQPYGVTVDRLDHYATASAGLLHGMQTGDLRRSGRGLKVRIESRK